MTSFAFVIVKFSLHDYDYDYFRIFSIRLRLWLRNRLCNRRGNRLYNRRDYTSLGYNGFVFRDMFFHLMTYLFGSGRYLVIPKLKGVSLGQIKNILLRKISSSSPSIVNWTLLQNILIFNWKYQNPFKIIYSMFN